MADIDPKIVLYELEEEVLETYLSTVPRDVELAELQPKSPVPTTGMVAPNDIQKINIRLMDWGVACFASRPIIHLIQSLPSPAPEVIILAGWDTKVDIWGLGVTVSVPSISSHKYTDVADNLRSGHLWKANTFSVAKIFLAICTSL